jgi:4-hydroxy-tetrahydrodipicolinate reductase
MVRIIVAGAAGRMGQRIIRLIQGDDSAELAGALEVSGHRAAGRDVGELIGIGAVGVPLSTELRPLLKGCDVLIDFTYPEATLSHLCETSAEGKSMVIGTTGFADEDLALIRESSKRVANLLAPNMSVGVNVLLQILPEVARALGDDFDVEIVEAHHHFKKDAPSGTAAKFAEVIARALQRDLAASMVHGRQGMVGERATKEIGIHAVRGGDIVGDHTVMFCGTGERIELTHRASSRDTFGKGAIRAAKWIVGQKPSLYSMLDLLGL